MSLLEREMLALSPGEAVQAAERAGLHIKIEYTRPPRWMPEGTVKERVVRFRRHGNTGIITVACEMIGERNGTSS
jgi:hypothetical protein